MAISGSQNFTITRDDIIESALKLVGAYDAGETVPAGELTDAANRLNLIAKEWTAEGIKMPVREKNILILNRGKQRYRLGNIGTTATDDDFHFFPATSLQENVLLTAESGGADATMGIDDDTWVDEEGLSITKAATTNDHCGVRLDDDNIHWELVGSVGTDTVILNNPPPSAASIGNKVYVYPAADRQTRPARILYAYREDTSRNSSQVELVGRAEYERLSMKGSSGPPTQIHYANTVQGFSSGESAGELFVWPAKNTSNVDKLILICEHYIDDFDTASDNLPLPVEYGNSLIWCLASELAMEYGIDRQTRVELLARAERKKSVILDAYDVENASVKLTRDMHGG